MPVLPVAPSRGVGFVPRQLPGCVLWCRADQGLGLNGSAVTQWNDLSGQGNNLVQSTAADQPTWSATAFNGKPGVSFNGTTQFMQSVANLNVQSTVQNTLFVVLQQTGTATTAEVIVEPVQTTTTTGWSWQGNTALPPILIFAVQQNETVYTEETGTAASPINRPAVIDAIFTANLGAGSVRATARCNGAAIATTNSHGGTVFSNFFSATTVTVGARTGGQYFFTGIIAEVAIFNQGLTTAQLQLLEQYAALTWGVPVTGVSQ